MKEDILEQRVENYLNELGYFTLANIKYKPDCGHPEYDSKQHCVHSDIDVLGYHPRKKGPECVYVVGCKSRQTGFWPQWEIDHMDQTVSGREGWQAAKAT